MSTRVYVGNIPYKATETQLTEFFSNIGQVTSVRMIVVPQTGQPKGFAFIEMATDELARKAIALLNRKPLMGRELRVCEARMSNSRQEGIDHGGRPGLAGTSRSSSSRL